MLSVFDAQAVVPPKDGRPQPRANFWLPDRPLPAGIREICHLLVADAIGQAHEDSRGTYGYRRVEAALRIERDLTVVNHKLVAKVVSGFGLSGLPREKPRKRNLIGVRTSGDLVNRDFTATEPNRLWVTDIAEHNTRESTVYACVALDVTPRKAVGWAVGQRPETSLVNSALLGAHFSRRPAAGGIIHADQGLQSISCANTCNVDTYGLRLSLEAMGDCYENAPIESFWAGLQTELLDWKKWTTTFELSTETDDYIAAFHNHERRRSSPVVPPPTHYDNRYAPMVQLT